MGYSDFTIRYSCAEVVVFAYVSGCLISKNETNTEAQEKLSSVISPPYFFLLLV